jgi:hypothetical protein
MLVLLVGACSDGDTTAPTGVEGTEPAAESGQPVGLFVLSKSGCRYEGPATVAAGHVSFALVGQTNVAAQFDLWQMNDGHTYAEFVAHLDEEQRRLEAGEPSLGHPTFATLVASTPTDPRDQATVTIDAGDGEYGMACIRLDEDNGGFAAAGPFVAT